MFQKIKDYIYEHRYIIGGAVVVGGIGILLATSLPTISAKETLTSEFMDDLKTGLVKTVEFSGSTAFYRTHQGLFKTFIEGIPTK